MLALTLSLCLTSMPSFPSARLLGAVDEFALTANVEQMSLEQLREERLRLLELRPSKLPAIAVMVGVPVVAYLASGLIPLLLGIGSPTTAILVACGVIGGAGFVAGTIWLIFTIVASNRLKGQIDYVDRLIRAATPPPTPLLPPPTEPPLPVPGVHAPGFVPQVLVAQF